MSHPQNPNTHTPGVNPDIWNNFTSDPTTGVTIITADGVIAYINEQSARIFFDTPMNVEELIGVSIYDLGFPKEWADERVKLMHKIVETGERYLLRTIWHGKQQYSWMSPISHDDEDQRDLVLVITRRIPGTQELHLGEGEIDVVSSDVICLGELNVLTARELEILALLGQGMSIKQIAATLFRSTKTIENHREAIGRKLNRTRGVELAVIAQSAGLRVDDHKRQRLGGVDSPKLESSGC
ncbi:MAG: LuxR C-terminal-related transcriptional regulator [Phycisphaerales bacterium]